jgi:pimeloyl-ACP methyl ester carboxylesterase
MKKKFAPLMQLSLIITIFFSTVSAAPLSPAAIPHQPDTQQILDDLGGEPCFEDSSFTCVTIEVPLNHFDPADTRTIPVVFAVLPASGVRKGMFVTATGGPGSSGVYSADYYSSGFDPGIFESFDIVFFDQRGLAFSGGLTCPEAATEYYQEDFRGITRRQERNLKDAADDFVEDCLDEMGDTELLPYLGTRQAIEDLEVFRQIIGDEKFWLYGESYGTQFAQTYAAVHGEHLAGLILDGTVDLTLSGTEYYVQQAQAFSDTLTATLSACNEDPACAEQMNGDAIAAYDNLVARLSHKPIHFKFVTPNGMNRKRTFTLSDLEYVASSQMYAESDRMMFLRALAAYASHGDIVPLARLLYIDLVVDPQTLEIIPDDSWSDAIFYAVECQDYGYPGATPNERAELYLDAMDPYETTIPRLASIIYGDLPCAYWPHASTDLTRPGYLLAEGIPTLVLGATADPATPVHHGIQVYEHLADGYLITTRGGPHVTFGYGLECPDAIVTEFLVNDVLPAERETICEGYLADDYVPIAPAHARDFADVVDALSYIETEIYYLPEFYYWDGFTPTSVGCTYGGTFEFDMDSAGTKYRFDFDRCAFARNFKMSGEGRYNLELDRFVLDVRITGRWKCDVEYVRRGDRVRVSGKCNGKPIKLEQQDKYPEEHKFPGFH